jgi:predicted AlkP superfamily phosphohydrolase/phosphomutase
MPGVVQGAPRIVVLLLDGLGWNQLQTYAEHMPTLASMTGGHITTVAPSTTATALTVNTSKLSCVFMSTPESKQPNPGCE